MAERAVLCVLQLSEDISLKNVTKATAFQRLHLINWEASWPHSSPLLAEALTYGCLWPSNAGAAAGGFLLRVLEVSSTWGHWTGEQNAGAAHEEPTEPSSAPFLSPAALLLQIDSFPAFIYCLPFQYYYFM